MNNSKTRFSRILLKLSGEALLGKGAFGIDPDILLYIAKEIDSIYKAGVKITVVIGGGNFFRGFNSSSYGVNRVVGDHIGMLATVINSLALKETLSGIGIETRVMSAIHMNTIAEPYIQQEAAKHLLNDRVVIVGAGTGNPYFTTDTAAVLRAIELTSDVLIKATKVDGVFDSDPMKNPDAVKFEALTYKQVLKDELRVMDLTAVSLAMDNSLPIIVFDLHRQGSLKNIILGEKVGTYIGSEA